MELGQFSVDTFTSEVDGTDVSTMYLTGVLYDGGVGGLPRFKSNYTSWARFYK